jgi:hypothetical protein
MFVWRRFSRTPKVNPAISKLVDEWQIARDEGRYSDAGAAGSRNGKRAAETP